MENEHGQEKETPLLVSFMTKLHKEYIPTPAVRMTLMVFHGINIVAAVGWFFAWSAGEVTPAYYPAFTLSMGALVALKVLEPLLYTWMEGAWQKA